MSAQRSLLCSEDGPKRRSRLRPAGPPRQCLIVLILCAECAPERAIRMSVFDGVAELLLTNAQTLAMALALLANHTEGDTELLDSSGFERTAAPLRETPKLYHALTPCNWPVAGRARRSAARHRACDRGVQANHASRACLLNSRRVFCGSMYYRGAPLPNGSIFASCNIRIHSTK
jgi:hypothetical protein